MSDAGFERWRQNFAAIIENLVGRKIDYLKLYPAVVVAQNSDGSLQLIADDPKVRGDGHNNVRVRHGLPGISVTVSQGARVRLGFEEGDPSKPFAALFDTDAAFVVINLGLAANTEFVALSEKTDDQFSKIKDMFTNWVTVANDGGAVLKALSDSLSFDSVAASKVKAE